LFVGEDRIGLGTKLGTQLGTFKVKCDVQSIENRIKTKWRRTAPACGGQE
jgi:hypothetical protein